jgi:hypothetical protein
MGTWKVDSTSTPGILRIALEGRLTADEMKAFVAAHNRAIDDYHGADYKVWCDISALAVLSQDCVALFEQAKSFSSRRPNFRGSAVLVASAVVALQHRRTSLEGGVIATELISHDVHALEQHLRTVYRRSE